LNAKQPRGKEFTSTGMPVVAELQNSALDIPLGSSAKMPQIALAGFLTELLEGRQI
jgi:hypothetical protein